MPAIGWFDALATAESYFTSERLETTAWDGLATDAKKTKALTQAYNRIFYSNLFDVPAYADATAAELVILQKAQAEMAYYLAVHAADEDRRKGIQAQGVTEAGIVKEKYADGSLSDIPIPPIVSGILEDFSTDGDEFYAQGVDRDEDDEDMAL
jgi:hypothetical protein